MGGLQKHYLLTYLLTYLRYSFIITSGYIFILGGCAIPSEMQCYGCAQLAL